MEEKDVPDEARADNQSLDILISGDLGSVTFSNNSSSILYGVRFFGILCGIW